MSRFRKPVGSRSPRESLFLSGVSLIVLTIWLNWHGPNPTLAFAYGAGVASALLLMPGIVRAVGRWRGGSTATASVAALRPTRVYVFVVTAVGAAAMLIADVDITVGTSAAWPVPLAIFGLIVGALAILFAVKMYIVGVVSGAQVPLSPVDAWIARQAQARLGSKWIGELSGVFALLCVVLTAVGS